MKHNDLAAKLPLPDTLTVVGNGPYDRRRARTSLGPGLKSGRIRTQSIGTYETQRCREIDAVLGEPRPLRIHVAEGEAPAQGHAIAAGSATVAVATQRAREATVLSFLAYLVM
jgi:hypothetical protein